MKSLHQFCIEWSNKAADACTDCISNLVKEDSGEDYKDCIRACIEGADFCRLSATLASRQSEYLPSFCQFCLDVCQQCSEACKQHDHPLTQKCATACDRCIDIYKQILETHYTVVSR